MTKMSPILNTGDRKHKEETRNSLIWSLINERNWRKLNMWISRGNYITETKHTKWKRSQKEKKTRPEEWRNVGKTSERSKESKQRSYLFYKHVRTTTSFCSSAEELKSKIQ